MADPTQAPEPSTGVPVTSEPAAVAAPSKPTPGFSEHEALPGVLADKPRDERGRFAPAAAPSSPASPAAVASDSDATGVSTLSGSSAPIAPSAPPPPPAKFKIGRLEFNSPEHAEQSHLTLQGLHRKQKAELQELRLRTLELENKTRQTAPPIPTPVTPGPTAEAEPEGIDWTVFDILANKHGQAAAQRWLAGEQERIINERVEGSIKKALGGFEERFKPLAQVQATLAKAEVLDTTINSMRQYQLPDGSQAYPELDKPQVLQEVRQLWIEMRMPEDLLLEQRGLHAAIEVYRGAMARRAGGTAPRTVPAPPAVIPTSPVASSAGRPAAPPGNGRVRSAAERILNAPLAFDDQLGFGR